MMSLNHVSIKLKSNSNSELSGFINKIIDKILAMKELFLDSLHPASPFYGWIEGLDLLNETEAHIHETLALFSNGLTTSLFPEGEVPAEPAYYDEDEEMYDALGHYKIDFLSATQDYKLAISRLIRRSLKAIPEKNIFPHDAVEGNRAPLFDFLSHPLHQATLVFLDKNIDKVSKANTHYLAYLNEIKSIKRKTLTESERKGQKEKSAACLRESREFLLFDTEDTAKLSLNFTSVQKRHAKSLYDSILIKSTRKRKEMATEAKSESAGSKAENYDTVENVSDKQPKKKAKL